MFIKTEKMSYLVTKFKEVFLVCCWYARSNLVTRQLEDILGDVINRRSIPI